MTEHGLSVDAGDKPEFTLYLPAARKLRLGVRSESKSMWLADAASVITRLSAGSML